MSTSKIFAAHNAMLASTQPSFGGGSANQWWPDAGQHDVFVIGLVVRDGTMRHSGVEYPSKLLTFQYRLVEDPGSPAEPRTFSGAPVNIPLDANVAQQSQAVQINMGRLKGILQVVLGEKFVGNDLDASLSMVQSLLDDPDATVAARCSIQANLDKQGKEWKKEYLVTRLSVA